MKRSKIVLMGIITIVVAFLIITLNINAKKTMVVLDSDVEIIKVTDHSIYIVDNRFGLCFYETQMQYVSTAIEIDCKKIKDKK